MIMHSKTNSMLNVFKTLEEQYSSPWQRKSTVNFKDKVKNVVENWMFKKIKSINGEPVYK